MAFDELSVEVELRGERAAALKRIGRTLEESVAELRRAEDALLCAPSERRDAARAHRDEVRRRTERNLWYLIVQREAVGFFRHDDLALTYDLPPGLVPRM